LTSESDKQCEWLPAEGEVEHDDGIQNSTPNSIWVLDDKYICVSFEVDVPIEGILFQTFGISTPNQMEKEREEEKYQARNGGRRNSKREVKR